MSIFGTQSEQNFASEVATAAADAEKATPEPIPAAEAPATTQGDADGLPASIDTGATPVERREEAFPPAPAEPRAEPQKMVPLAAVQEERERRQKLEQDFANLTEAFNRFQQHLQQPPQEQPFDPLEADPNQDPFAVIQALQQRVRQSEDNARVQAETEQVKTAYLGTIRQAVTVDPTFQDAYQHLVQSRIGELTAMGMNPLAANETIKQEELHLARTAFMSGRNPAEVILSYAKARGFAPKAKEPPPPPAPVEQVKAQAERAAAATSISAGGKPPKNDPSMDDIAALNGAAFDSAWDKFASQAGKSTSLFRN